MKLITNISFLTGIIASVISSPVAATTLPCANLLTGMRHKLCRIVPSGNTLTITITLSAETVIDAIGIGGFNLTSAATCRCLIKNVATTTVYDSGTVAVYGHVSQSLLPWFSRTRFWFPPASVSAKKIEITIGTADLSVDISHFVFGTDTMPSVNPDWGSSWNWVDTSIQQRTAGGSLLANPNYGYRKAQIAWPVLPDSDWNKISSLLQSQGQSLMVSVMPGENSRREADMQMIGRLVSADGINLTEYNINSLASVVIEEI